jgi:restriction system protein
LNLLDFEYYRRLLIHHSYPDREWPWEGNTWILDLLPHFPKKALEALDAYIVAHAQILPDSALFGHFDAAEIIRARYIGLPGTHQEGLDFLASLDPRQFECVVERLYRSMGYETELTSQQGDGGRDINAYRTTTGQRERLLIECKLYSRPVGVELTRRLYGSVHDARANRGVLASNNYFTRGAKTFAARNSLELIGGAELIPLLNQHLGLKWPLHIERLVQESLKTEMKRKGSIAIEKD